jgi:hypothetical protein
MFGYRAASFRRDRILAYCVPIICIIGCNVALLVAVIRAKRQASQDSELLPILSS